MAAPADPATQPPAGGDDVQQQNPPATAEGHATTAAGEEPELSKTHQSVFEHARLASGKEQTMTLMQGLKLYPKAIAFSIIISTCIVMEGYDISLVTNFCKLGPGRDIVYDGS